MNITFLIGNGFDVNLGLKTKYTDFYPVFIQKSKETNMIKKWINEDISLWSDLELQLGNSLKDLDDNKLENFFNDKDELDSLLNDYLEKQQTLINDATIDSICGEFVRSIRSFEAGLPNEYEQAIKKVKTLYVSEDYNIQFLVFNYTNIIDRLVELAKNNGPLSKHVLRGVEKYEFLGNVIHVHGSLDSNMILGINDVSQINNEQIKENYSLQNYIIKEKINNGIKENIINLSKDIIDNSHILCVYGMSFGDTDNMWWEYIIGWLLRDSNNILLCYNYVKDVGKIIKLPARRNHITKEMMDCFLIKKELTKDEYDSIANRIFVIVESNIFKFKLESV